MDARSEWRRRGARLLLAVPLAWALAACTGGDGGTSDPDGAVVGGETLGAGEPANGGETPGTNGPVDDGTASASGFPTVWTLSRRRFDLFTGMFVVRERWVVAYEDGTYTRDLDAIHGERVEAPGTGERLGEWRIEDGRLLTRYGDDETFDPQFFARTFRTRPGGADQRLDGCFGGTEVPFGFTIVFREICFTPDGLYRSSRDDLGDFTEAPEASGAYTIDGHRLWLSGEDGERVAGAFAVLAGESAAPDSIMLQGERYSRR